MSTSSIQVEYIEACFIPRRHKKIERYFIRVTFKYNWIFNGSVENSRTIPTNKLKEMASALEIDEKNFRKYLYSIGMKGVVDGMGYFDTKAEARQAEEYMDAFILARQMIS